jgi:thioesterase domain-containing protein/acyl carrier protein
MEKVPLDGDFLALGGDSLSVEEMLADLGERYGIELASTELLGNPTLREFAARVAEGAAAKATHPDWVHLRTGAEDRRVFAFAGAGALALQFLPLARRLDGWDVMAFQAHGLERRALPDWSVQAHARRALTEIRRLQPHGPYRLMGHSFGGMVAYEIAQQLRAAGEQVAVLGVIDTFLPKNAMDELQVTKEFGRMIDRPSPSLLGRIAKHVLPRDASLETTSRLRTFVRLTRARTAGVVRYQGQQQFDTFFYQSVLAGRSYKPQPYAGRALVVNGLGNPTDDAAWEELLVGEHRMVRVDGEHSALMREPHVAQLAAALMEELDASVDAELPAR